MTKEEGYFFNEGKDFLSFRFSNGLHLILLMIPEYALKLYNRGEKHSYYFLDAEDATTPIIIPGYQRSYSGLLGQESCQYI